MPMEAISQDQDDSKRERSTIEFPYMDLEDAVEVAKAVHRTTGSTPCQHDQLAAALNLSMNSSGYRVRISTTKVFGLIDSDRGSGAVKLTELGQMAADTVREREAKAKAFLNVPLFKKIYEQNRGKQLPPAAALEREMAGMGVAEKQKERARQVFQRSAEVAGFFDLDKTRLIMPTGISEVGAALPPASDPKPDADPEFSGGNGGGGKNPDIDPIIRGLLVRLPKSGENWPKAKRKLWLQLLEGSFDLIYTDGPEDHPESMK
jgi:hypothetical protein